MVVKAKLWSHPEVALSDHLVNTLKNIDLLLSNTTLPSIIIDENNQLDGEDFKKLALFVGGVHDVGKATTYFQQYIRETDPRKKNQLKTPESNHSLLGAIYAFYAVPRIDILSNIKNPKIKKQLALIAATSILKHHGDLVSLRKSRKNIRDEIKNTKKQHKVIRKQIEAVDPAQIDEIIREVETYLKIQLPKWEKFVYTALSTTELEEDIRKAQNLFKQFDKSCDKIISTPRPNTEKIISQNPLCFNLTIIESLIYSVLQEADKTDAMSTTLISRINKSFYQILERYHQNAFPEEKTNDFFPSIRSKLYKEAKNYVDTLNLGIRTYKLEAPTGSGKTLANLVWAFKLRHKLQKQKNKTYRVVYLLPFLSIIEQVHQVINTVFSMQEKNTLPSNLLLKHHHLIQIEYKTHQENEEFTPNQELFYIEGWNSEIIVSTFYQFFHTLYSNKKKNMRKYNKFLNTIFILDEVQSVPLKYWLLLEKTLPVLLEKTDSYLLMSTATQPAILHEKLVNVSNIGIETYKKLNRIRIVAEKEKLPYKDFISQKIEKKFFDKNKSTIIITNTVSSAQQLFIDAKSQGLDNDFELFHLSTGVIPKHRLDRINKIKIMLHATKTNKRPLLFTTQLIEAGVDLSFQKGFRDMAPLDSIIQASGRVNRHGKEKHPSEIIVQPLTHSSNNKELSKMIYDKTLIDLTKKVFEEHGTIEEKMFPDIIKNYFIKAREKTNEQESRKILNYFCKAEFSKFKEFHLIEEKIERYPLFIGYDSHAEKTWQEYKKLATMKDWKQRQAGFLKIKKQLYEYVINIDKRVLEKISDDLEYYGGFFKLNKNLVHYYYSPETGFKKEGVEDEELVF